MEGGFRWVTYLCLGPPVCPTPFVRSTQLDTHIADNKGGQAQGRLVARQVSLVVHTLALRTSWMPYNLMSFSLAP